MGLANTKAEDLPSGPQWVGFWAVRGMKLGEEVEKRSRKREKGRRTPGYPCEVSWGIWKVLTGEWPAMLALSTALCGCFCFPTSKNRLFQKPCQALLGIKAGLQK